MVRLITSKKFWVALIGLIVVVVQSFNDSFVLNTEELAGFVVIVVSYLVGVSIDDGGGLATIFRSRKFWAAFSGGLVVVLKAAGVELPVTGEQLAALCVIISGYIIGVASEKPLQAK